MAAAEVLVLPSEDEEEEEEGGSQWFNTREEELRAPSGTRIQYAASEDDATDDESSGDFDEDDSLFFSDEDLGTERDVETESRGINKTAQLGAEVAQARQQLHTVYSKLEECEKSVENCREEVNQCRARQKTLGQELAVTDGEIAASTSNIPNVQRLNNLKKRLNTELLAELDLERNLEEYLKSQELALNQVLHEKGQFQHLELALEKKEETLVQIKSTLVQERKLRERKILENAERRAISKEIKESLVNLEHEDRTKAAIAAARKAQKDGQRFLKETWKRVKEREKAEEEERRRESEHRVKMLLQYKENLHKTQHKLKKNSQRKARSDREKEAQRMTVDPEQRFQTEQKQRESQKKNQFEATQRQAKSALITKILNEEQEIEKRKGQQPQLFSDRLTGRHNKPTPQKYKHIIDLAKPPKVKASKKLEAQAIPTTVGYSSSEEEEEEKKVEHPVESLQPAQEREDMVLIEPEFRGLWESVPPPPPPASSKFSKLEQQKMQEVLEKQRQNIVQKQITVQREFKGQAFMSKPEEVLFSDYIVGETYSQLLTLTNVSYTINTLKLIGLSTNLLDFISVEFSPPGHLSAGLTCDMKVTFSPLINKDITGEIKMLAQTGAFSIPVKCRVKRTQITIPTVSLDFGTVCIGEHQKAYIKIVNLGALGTNYKVRPVGWANNSTPSSKQGEEKEEEEEDRGNEVATPPRTEDPEFKKHCSEPTADLMSTVTFAGSETLPGTPTSEKKEEEVGEESREISDVSLGRVTTAPAAEEEEEVVVPDISLDAKSSKGFIAPFSTVQVEVLYDPRTVAQHVNSFLVTVADNSIDPVTVTVKANTIDLPIYVQEQTMYLKYCMVDRLYQDSVVLHNRATSALRIKFEIPKALKDHVDVLPQNGVVQANSSFSAQLKFIPLSSIFENCKKYFSDGQLLKIPVRVKVADQTRSVPFTVSAHVTGTDVSFSAKELDFGCCSIYESARVKFSMTNHCLLPQLFGFVSLPDFVTIQPNDGFGTLLPGETLNLEAVVHAKVLGDHTFNITCTTEIDRHFSLRCKATGVIPHLEVSHPLIRFAPTALGDVRQASFYISNNARDGQKTDQGRKSFHIVVPEGIDLIVSPSVGTLNPGQRLRVQLTFGPTLKPEDIENEAMEAAKNKILEEIERKKREDEEADKLPKSKAKKGGSKPITPKSPHDAPSPNPLDSIVITEENRIAAMVKLKTNFQQRFDKILVPCFTAVGECSHDSPIDYRMCDTIYLQVHLPAVKPELILLSQNDAFGVGCGDGISRSVVDFGNVCIGQTKKLGLTLKSITDNAVKLSCSPFPHDGTFQKVNATRNLEPHGLHQMLLEFTPKRVAKYYETVEVRTERSTLHLHLHGSGVEPCLVVTPESGVLDIGHVMVGEVLMSNFTLTNKSEIDLQYSNSLLSEKFSVVQGLSADSEVGNSNASGILPFQCSPHSGTIKQGQSQEICVRFTPDQQDSYRDVVIVKLLNQPQETRIAVSAHAWTGSMYPVGGKTPNPSLTLHTLVPQLDSLNLESEPEEMVGSFYIFFVCSMSVEKQVFTETMQIGNCRGAGTKPELIGSKVDKGVKLSGDFVFDPLKADFGPLVKALVVNPQKGTVDAGAQATVSFQFTPPKELVELGARITFNTLLTLKGETNEQFRVNFVAEIVE